MTRLSLYSLMNIAVPLPPLDVQEAMVSKIEKLRKEISEREKTMRNELINFNDMAFGKNRYH